jgi:hypothetical protein
MMDARPLLPQGWHFADEHLAPNGVDTVTPFSRTNHPVRYIIIDYDTSVWFRPDESHMISRPGGRDSDPPELNTFPMEPYDAFKLDVFTVGNTYSKEFVKACCDYLPFIASGNLLNEFSVSSRYIMGLIS